MLAFVLFFIYLANVYDLYCRSFASPKLSTFNITYISFIYLSDVGGVQEGGLTDVAIEVLHRLLSHVIHGPREQVGVGDDQVSAFMETLKKGLNFSNPCDLSPV